MRSGEWPEWMIGEYRVLRKLGEGGMGVVYVAEQQHPKRLVALKVIHGGGFVDDHQIKLFEREAQALARLKHPGIASIYESGRTPDGQHFFAMELVRGETLEKYLAQTAQASPTPAQLRERLALFRRISDAVTYAHQRGVIHRDLKPSNVIVQYDIMSADPETGSMVPAIKILDFGLARITEADLDAASVRSEIGRVQGTLPYMSPEQVRGNPDEIDLRTDVYSLGVILYEMIAGRRPYELHKAMLHEAARIICETPPTPLTKSWSGSKRLDHDLETIVAKSLEKQPTMRYQNVSAFSDDVGRFLTGQAILARPPSAFYQIRKLVARHKAGFGIAVTLLALLAAFAVVISIQAERIARERDRANREARSEQQVSEFLVGLFAVSDPIEGRGRDVTAREMLDRGSHRIAAELREQPQVRAMLADTMGRVYRNLGLFDKAAVLFSDALSLCDKLHGRQSLEAAASLNSLGVIKMEQSDYPAAERLLREALEIRRRRSGPESIEVAESFDDLASLRYHMGDWKASEQLYRDCLAIHTKLLASDDLRVATVMNNLALVLRAEEQFDESESLYRKSLAIRRANLGEQHPLIAQSVNNLGMLYLSQRRYSEAEAMFQEALTVNRRSLGDEHPDIAANLNNLALVNLEQNKLAEAESYYWQVLALDRKIYGDTHEWVAQTFQSLGVVQTRQRKFPDAEANFRHALALKMIRFPADHWEIATTKNLLGACLTDASDFKRAEPLLVESFDVISRQFGPLHDRTRRAATRLINLYEKSGRKEKADALRAQLQLPK